MSENAIKGVIKNYLDERAKTDELFAKSYAKENKSLTECCQYIIGEARKRGNAVAMTDDEVFGLAVHYYDEDDIKINMLPAGTRTVTRASSPPPVVELTEEERKASREAAMKRLADEQYAMLRKKSVRAKKEATEVQQMSLF